MHKNISKEKKENFWMNINPSETETRPQLNQSTTVDVTILGAGFTGLWIAYYLKENDPSLEIAILEKEFVGFGASGRNGGWCSPKFPVTPEMLIKKFGHNATKELQKSMFDAVDEVERVVNKEEMEIDWEKSGSLQVSLGNYNFPLLEKALDTYRSLDLDNFFNVLNKKQTSQEIKINGASGGLFTKKSAVLHPGKLVKQLAKVLEKKGVKIYEKTEVVDFKEGNNNKNSCFITNSNIVANSRKASILAGESYLSQLNGYKRKVMPAHSLITLTKPLTKTQWSNIGWDNRVTLSSTALSVHYLQKTKDGRILFGGRGAPYHYGSKIKESFNFHKPTHKMLKQTALSWFPTLTENDFAYSWGGTVGMSRDWMPNFTFNNKTKIGEAWGYVGQGVSTANLAGRILSDLILENDSKVTHLPMVQHISRKWEPEPFRWLGARYVQSGMERVDKKSQNKRQAPTGKSLPERLSRH